MRAALLPILLLAGMALAGCQTRPGVPGDAQANSVAAELQAASVTIGATSMAITTAGSLVPSGMGAGAAHAVNRAVTNAQAAQVNARIWNRIAAEEAAVTQCIEESKAMSGKAAEAYGDACIRRARGIP